MLSIDGGVYQWGTWARIGRCWFCFDLFTWSLGVSNGCTLNLGPVHLSFT